MKQYERDILFAMKEKVGMEWFYYRDVKELVTAPHFKTFRKRGLLEFRRIERIFWQYRFTEDGVYCANYGKSI